MTVLFSFIMITGLVLIDQITKLLINQNIPKDSTVPVINGVFHISNVKNTGGAFSIFSGNTWVLSCITAIVLAVLLYLIIAKKIHEKFLVYSLSLVIAGGLGNLIDRIFYGEVTDFIDVRIINFAVFNFADCCVVIGCGFILLYILFLEGRKKQKKSSGGEKNDG